MSEHRNDLLRTLRGALDALPDVVYVLDEQGAVLHLAQAAERLYGRSVPNLLTTRDFRLEMVDAADRPRVEKAYAGLKEGRRLELTYNIRRPDGVVGTVRERLSMRHGKVQGVICALRTDEQLALPIAVRTALDDSPQLCALLDWSRRFRWVNGAFDSHLGLDRNHLVGQAFIDLVHPEDRFTVQSLEADTGSRSTTYIECRTRTGGGEWRWVAWLCLPWAQRGRHYVLGIDIDDQRRAADAHAEAIEKAEVARGATYDGLWDVDLVTGEITGNARLYAMLGYADGEIELRYDNWLSLVHPDDRETVAAAYEEHLWGGAPMYQLEHRLLRADGTVCWVLARGQVVSRQGGFNPMRMVGTYTDITERRLVQDALAQSEERARCIVDAVTVPMIITSLSTGQVLFANPHAESLFGTLCTADGDFYRASADREAFIESLEQDGRVADLETAFTDHTGRPIWVIAAASLIEFDGDPAVLATFSDITRRRAAEEAIRDRNETQQLILRTTSDGIWDWDLRTDAVEYSARWKEMLGYAPDELHDTAATWRRLIHVDDLPVAERRLADHLERGVPFEHTSRYRHKDGELRWILVRGHALRDAEGVAYRMVGNHTDISGQIKARDERRRMEGRLQTAQRLESLGMMAGGVAHDFNNILAGILGNAELALLELDGETGAHPMLAEICDAVRRAGELCNQLLSYAGEGKLVLEAVDVGVVIREMQQLLEASISRKAHLELDCFEDLPAIRADAGRLRQVVANLVLNASDALGGRPGTIRITTGLTDLAIDRTDSSRVLIDPLPADLYVFVDIEDDGEGIEPDIVARIFDPFFTTRGGRSRGLGLAAVLGIMRGHGGSVEVDSTVGEGTIFRLLFPIVRDNTRARQRSRFPGVDTGSLRDLVGDGTILFVDDEVVIRELGLKVLGRIGFQVNLASDGREAVQAFRQLMPDVRAVVLDWNMPHWDGVEVYRILRTLDRNVPVLLMSGFPDQDVVTELSTLGPVAFLAKPFTRSQLLGALGHLLGNTHDPDDDTFS